MSLLWPILNHAIRSSRRTAVIDDQRRYTYAELCGGALFIADQIESATTNRHVGILLPTSGAFSATLLGIWLAKRVAVPLNYLLKPQELRYVIEDSGIDTILTSDRMLEVLGKTNEADGPVIPSHVRLLKLEELDTYGMPPLRWPPQFGDDDLAVILYTSGTSGRPKGVMLSHANMWLGAVSVAHYLGMAEDDVTLAVLPLSFDYGQSQLLSTWYAGGCVVPLDYLFPRDVAKACARHAVTTLAAVPPLWLQLTDVEWPAEAIGSMRRLTNSGGALTLDLVRDLRGMFPQSQLFPMYGLTEAFRSTYLDPVLVDTHPTSMGRAIPFAEILVMADDGSLAGPGQEGELVHCGPLVAQGYWQDAERTAERFKPAPAMSEYGGTAVWSGDRVLRDADGLLHFVGRRDAMIKSAGNRISPQEIESAAVASGLVAEAVALGVQDERLGHAIHLVVRPAGGSDDPESGLRKALQKELPNFMQPHVIHWRDTLPLNPNGKLDRTAIATEIGA